MAEYTAIFAFGFEAANDEIPKLKACDDCNWRQTDQLTDGLTLTDFEWNLSAMYMLSG